jgi:WD40 repeat protein
VRIWNPQVQPRLRLLLRSRRTVRRVVVGSNGRILALGGAEGAGLVRTQTGRTVRSLDDRPVADFSLAARRDLAATARARRVTVRRISTGEVVRRFDSRTPVDSIALSADGRVVATAHSSGTARIWTARGRLVHMLRGHEGAVTDVAFSPDARRLATASMDGTARIWRTDSGRVEHTLDGHRAAVLSAAFRPDGNSVVTTSLDGDARTWKVRSGEPLRVLRGHQGRVSSAAYSTDGRWIVTAGPENAGIWQARSGQLLFFVAGHTKRLTSVAFAPDGHRIFTASLDGTVRTYACEVCASLDGLVALAERRLAAARPS